MDNCWQGIEGTTVRGEKVIVMLEKDTEPIKSALGAWREILRLERKGKQVIVKTPNEVKKISPEEIKFLSGDVEEVIV